MSSMMVITFAENLRQFMKDYNVNQVKLSNDIHIAQSAISAWLSGKKEPCIASLWLLADYFDCTVDELIGRKLF